MADIPDSIVAKLMAIVETAKTEIAKAKADGNLTAAEVLGVAVKVATEVVHDAIAIAASLSLSGLDKKQIVIDTVMKLYDVAIEPVVAAALPWFGAWIAVYAIRPLLLSVLSGLIQGTYEKTIASKS